MLKQIFLYELKYWLKKPAFYTYILVFSSIAFLTVAGTAGLFNPSSNQEVDRFVNSPFEINYFIQYFNKLMLFLLPAIIGATIYKDYNDDSHSILYSFPIKKRDYLFGKFFSGLFLVFSIAICIGFTMILAEHLPGLHENKIGTFNIKGYIQAIFVYTLPNLLIYGAITFSVVTYFRNIYAGFIVVLILFFLQNIAQNVFNGFWIWLFDPFGQNTVLYETQYWTLEDKNTKLIPVFGAVLYNRLFWFVMAAATFGFVYKKFAFTEQPIASFFKKKKSEPKINTHVGGILNIELPKVSYDFSGKQQIKNAWLLSNINFKTIVKSWMFYIVATFGILAVLFAIGKVTNNSEITILPVTNIVLTIPAFFFMSIIILLTFIYGGMLVHKDASTNMNQLVAATPISNFALLSSKVIAIIKMQALLLTIMMLAGIIIQVYNGYYKLEIGLYLFHLFILQFIGLIIWAFTSVFVHSIIRNTYLGIFILILLWFGISGLKQIGIDSHLLLFNFYEPMQYSDLNEYANQLRPYFLVKSYWFVFGILLLILAYSFGVRGVFQSIKERFSQAKLNFNGSTKILLSISLTAFVTLGFIINSEENKSTERSSKDRNKTFDQFEKSFSKYTKIKNQPKITTIHLNIEIFPNANSLNIDGSYTLINKTIRPIDTLLIKTGFDENTELTLNKSALLIEEDQYVKFNVFRLQESLQPNDSLRLDFNIKNKANTLFENNSNVLNNGTFFKNDILPRIGYFLNSNNKHPGDSTAKNKHYYSQDSDLVSLKTVISTSKNQTAIAPGYLKKRWIDNDRNYFEYATDSKIKNSLSFSSGEFKIDKETYKGVDLEIYHHENHTENLLKMKEGLKASLDYNTKYFGDYQFTEARIVEFPITEGTFASVMANSIPTSEMRFIANANNKETIDISFYTIAHELTHQWWANQVVPADAFGAVMLSESITEYISLNIYREYYGENKALDFLKMQRERYLNRRTRETDTEPPLFLVKGEQQYLSYGKGSIAFNALSHYAGKDKLHTILKDFFNEFKNKEAPYPTSLDLIDHFKKEVPNDLLYLITDYFTTVTFYDNAIESAEVVLEEDNRYKVKVNFTISKHRNEDETKSLLLNDNVEIGFYNSDDELILIEKLKVNEENNFKIFKLKEKPEKVILDPNYLMIEKNRENNTKAL